MEVPYTDAEAEEARQWSNRHGPPNAWSATAGTAAMMIGRLLDERERLMAKETVMAPGDDYIREWHDEFQRWKAVSDAKEDLRDQFAAAALTGLIASREWPIDSEEAAHYCYRVAEAMLRERGNHIADAGKMVETLGEWRAPNGCHPTAVWHELLRTKEAIKDIADDVCGVGSGVTVNSPLASDWLDAIAAEYHRVRIELSQLLEKTNHDAAPAATARTDADRGRTDKADSRPGKGTGDTHPMQTTPGECSKPREGT